MSEPSNGKPREGTETDVELTPNTASQTPDTVELDVDEEKLEKWDEVKSDYQIDPDGKPMPNVWDAGEAGEGEAKHEAEQREEGSNHGGGDAESAGETN